MYKTVHKTYAVWSHRKEETWLNQMSQQGWNLVSVNFLTYVFSSEESPEYEYRLVMLEHWPGNPESRAYIEFVESTGAEYIGSVFRWVYFKKKAELGEFSLFSDNTSRLAYLTRLFVFSLLLFIALVLTQLPTIARFGESPFFILWPLLSLAIIILIGYGTLKTFLERRRVKKEQLLFE